MSGDGPGDVAAPSLADDSALSLASLRREFLSAYTRKTTAASINTSTTTVPESISISPQTLHGKRGRSYPALPGFGWVRYLGAYIGARRRATGLEVRADRIEA